MASKRQNRRPVGDVACDHRSQGRDPGISDLSTGCTIYQEECPSAFFNYFLQERFASRLSSFSPAPKPTLDFQFRRSELRYLKVSRMIASQREAEINAQFSVPSNKLSSEPGLDRPFPGKWN
jgi:hypothetical protein